MSNLFCISCKVEKGPERKDSYCKECRNAKSKENKHKAALAKGHVVRPKNSVGRNPNCKSCNEAKGPGYQNGSYCRQCESNRKKIKRETLKASKPEKVEIPKIPLCATCKSPKENPKNSYCHSCNRKRDNEYRIAKGITKKHQTGLCPCGAERAPSNRSYCHPCANRQSKEWRKIHGFTVQELERRSERQKANYTSKSKGRVRRAGTLVNGVAVSCVECDKLSEGWCYTCDLTYTRNKQRYHQDEIFKLKSKVRALTRGYIKAGVLVKEPCKFCGTTKTIEAHHEDYTKPLEIMWLCAGCHNEWHKYLRASEMTQEQIEADNAEIENELNLTEDK